MASLNRVLLIGNLTRDPEIRYLPSGVAVGDMRLAVSRKFRSQGGEDREETCYVDIVVWQRTAELCGQYLTKGSPILVEGRLQLDEWEKDGQKRSQLRVVAENVQFLSSGRRGEYADTDGAPRGGEARGGAPRGGDARGADSRGDDRRGDSRGAARRPPEPPPMEGEPGEAMNQGADDDDLPF